MEHTGVKRLPIIAICGPGRSGKDETAKWLAANTPLRFSLGTSQVIAPHIAAEDGISVEEAYARRHEDRDRWFRKGNELRVDDHAYLVRECLKQGEIVVGLRNADEVVASRSEGLIDLFLWIERDVEEDPTMTFGPELCDIIIDNNCTIPELHERLAGLARFAGLIG